MCKIAALRFVVFRLVAIVLIFKQHSSAAKSAEGEMEKIDSTERTDREILGHRKK